MRKHLHAFLRVDPKPETKRTTVDIPIALHEEFLKATDEDDRSMNEVIIAGIRLYLHERKADK